MRREPWTEDRAWEYAHNPIRYAPARLRPFLEEFLEWLRRHRGMAAGSVRVRITSAREFVRGLVGDQDVAQVFRALAPLGVERAFQRSTEFAGPAARRHMRSGVKALLSYLAERGLVRRELLDAVPSVKTYRLSHVVRALPDSEIRRLLESVDQTSDAGMRDHAILLILATYGARRGQVSSLRLGDVLWADRLIRIPAHKGGKDVLQPLVGEVAGSLSRYLERVRPREGNDRVFLRLPPPHLQLSPTAISIMVRTRLDRAGIESRNRGPHIFRHAFATRQLKAGRSLKSVADHLGHRYLASAAIYTKVDQPSLREVAIAWPEVLR